MRARSNRYIVKVYEAQWDRTHEASVRPFFTMLKRESECDGHDAMFTYEVFQTADSLKSLLATKDRGADSRLKIAYIGAHGLKDRIMAAQDISLPKLRNVFVSAASYYDGIYFGTCDFCNESTAKYLLKNVPNLKWVAGFAQWVPWLEGCIADTMFFELLFSGRFVRGKRKTKWLVPDSPEEAAYELYKVFPMAVDLKFSLFTVKNGVVTSTLENFTLTQDI